MENNRPGNNPERQPYKQSRYNHTFILLPTTGSKRARAAISIDDVLEDVAAVAAAVAPVSRPRTKRAPHIAPELRRSEFYKSNPGARARGPGGKFVAGALALPTGEHIAVPISRSHAVKNLRARRQEVLTALKVKRAQRKARGRVKKGTITALKNESRALLAQIRETRGYVPPARVRRPPPPRRRRA